MEIDLEVRLECAHCGLAFEVPKSMVGGYANCPECGKASPVEGLRDPLWRAWKVVAVAAAGLAAYIAYEIGGAGAAVCTLFAGLGIGWLVSRAF